MTLRHRAFSAVRWTTGSALLRGSLQIAQVAVLARLLVPEDYGLMAMVSVVLGFASLFQDMGVNSAYVQRQAVSAAERSSLFWLNVGLSCLLSLLVIAVSPLLARYFGDERLTPLLMLCTSTFVLNALGQQVRMSAEKTLNFKPLVFVESVTAVLTFLAAVAAALAGWGVYALLVGGILGSLLGTFFVWVFLANGWRPMWRFRYIDVKSYLGFGSALVVNNIANQINSTLDIFLGGRLLSTAALGLYSVPRNLALQVQMMINPVVTRVGFPLMAQVQNDVGRVRSIYLQTMNMTASINAPLYVGLAFFAPEIVALLLGPGWERAADLLQILALWGGLRSTGNPVGSLLLGMGRADLSMKWNLSLLLVTPPSLWFGAQFGAEGMAWSMLGVMAAYFIPAWFFLVRPLCKAELWTYCVAALLPFALATLAIAPAYVVVMLFEAPLARLLTAVLISAPLYLILSYLLNRDWFLAMRQLVYKH